MEIAAISTLIQQTQNTPSTQRSFDRAYYETRCRAMNEAIGKLDDGYNCERCRNKGFVYTLADDGEILSNECPDCYNARTSLRLLKNSGLENKTFENFIVKADWQGGLLRTVKEFAADTSGKWLFIGGQSGCGKTHLCTAALREIILTQNKAVRVLKWVEHIAIGRADIELQAAKALSWTSDEKFLEMLKAARERRAETD